MGAVYRARDTRLDREVALKILPELFASDPERLARFEREAKTLAALNHPHIAQIHNLEQQGHTSALVMELVAGQVSAAMTAEASRRREAAVEAEIAQKYRVHLEAMIGLHDAVTAMLCAGTWTITKRRGVNPFVVTTMIGLLTKATKTFRAIQILCQRGLYQDAGALVRVLMETTVAIGFILQKNSKQRALIYHAHRRAGDKGAERLGADKRTKTKNTEGYTR